MPTIKYKENGQWKYITTGSGNGSSPTDNNLYVQNDEPVDAPIGSVWVDMDETNTDQSTVLPDSIKINVDGTLSIEGMPADAKAVRDEINALRQEILGGAW